MPLQSIRTVGNCVSGRKLRQKMLLDFGQHLISSIRMVVKGRAVDASGIAELQSRGDPAQAVSPLTMADTSHGCVPFRAVQSAVTFTTTASIMRSRAQVITTIGGAMWRTTRHGIIGSGGGRTSATTRCWCSTSALRRNSATPGCRCSPLKIRTETFC